ncbi:MAG TPA: DUF4214 domain-containing protein [Noviherbaspirillum sp.]
MTIANSTEPNDTFSQANTVSLGNTIIGSLSSGTDKDFYKVVMPASGVLRIDMSSSQLPDWAYSIQVYDASHKLLGEGWLGYVNNASFSVGARAAGTYYISVASSNIYSWLSYSITPSLGSGSAQDYEAESNDTLQTATPVSLDRLISGQQDDSDDVDNFSIDVGSSGMLSLDFKVPEKLDYAYYQVNLYDSQGRLIDQKTSGDSFSLLEAGISAGRYTVQVKKSGTASGYEQGNYTFLAHLDPGSSLPAKATLSDVAPITASIGATNQADWYKLDLKAGSVYEFRLSGGTLADSSLVLCTADGKVLENCSNLPTWGSGGTVQSADPQIAFVAPYSGSYYLKVAGLGGTGSYTLSEKTDTLANLSTALTGNAITQEHWPVASSSTALTLTYAFLTATADGEIGFRAMNTTQKQAVRNVLAQYSAFANIEFREVSDPALAQICYGTSDQHGISGGVTYTRPNTGGALTHADVFLNNTPSYIGAQAEADMLSAGQYGLATLIHETGHALGLKHPGDYNAFSGGGTAPFIPAAWDNRKFSVMSYIDDPDMAVYDQTPSLLDVVAIQSLYGARSSGSAQTFSFSNSTEFKATVLSGSAANNTLDLSTQTADCFISLTPGTFSSVGLKQDGTLAHDNLAIPFGTCISRLNAGSGNDTIIGNDSADIINAGAGNDTIIAGNGGETINGGSGTDMVVFSGARSGFTVTKTATGYTAIDHGGTQGTNTLTDVETLKFANLSLTLVTDPSIGRTYTGSDGNDVLQGSAGDDILNGGAGLDTVAYTGVRNHFTVTRTSDGMTVTDNTGTEGIDTLSGIERIRFADTALAFDTDGTAGQAYRLYQAAFNRQPDIPGLGFWIGYMDKGMSLAEVASHFEESVEFINLYGANISNDQLVTLLYKNVLHRDPEPAGFTFWMNILNTGQQSRPAILTSFSESPENKAQIIGSIQDGMQYTFFS